MDSVSGQASEQLYQSIDSDNSNFNDKTEKEVMKFSQKQISEKDITRQIVFPQKPKQFDKILTIYKNNSLKMKKLDKQVKQMEATILQQMRLKHSKNIQKSAQTDMEEIVQLILEDDPIEQFEEKRKHRQQNLLQLNSLYDALKKLNKVEAFLSKQQNQEKMIEKVKRTKEVNNYRICQEYLVVTSKQKIDREKIENEAINIEESGIYFEEEDHEDVKHTIGIFNLDNLKSYLTPKKIDFDIDSEITAEKVQEYRSSAQKFLNLAKKVNITGISHITTSSYSHKHKLIFIFEANHRILVYNFKGQQLQCLQLDKFDEVVLFNCVGDQFVVGTKQGIIRVYSIQPPGQLHIAKICICHWKDGRENVPFKVRGQKCAQSVLFVCDAQICQLNLKTNVVCEIESIDEKIYKLCSEKNTNKNAILSALTLKKEGKKVVEKMFEQISIQKHSEILHIFMSSKDQSEGKDYILVGNYQGSFQLVPLE